MVKRFFGWIIILVVVLYVSEGVTGNEGPGETYEFLKLGGGARAFGMGNAYVAVVDDASAIYWNPAGLGLLKKKEGYFAYRKPVIDNVGEQYGCLNGVFPLNKRCTVSFGSIHFGVDNIEKTGMNNYEEPIILGEFKDTEWALIGSIGWEQIRDLCYFGVNIKYLKHTLNNETGKGLGFDLGYLANLSEAWDLSRIDVKFGAIIRYLSDKKWDSGHKDPGDIEGELGFALVPYSSENNKFTLGINAEKGKKQPIKASMGGELQLFKILALRTGIDNWYFLKGRHELDKSKLNYVQKITFGVGFNNISLRGKLLQIDWASALFGDFKERFAPEHQISLGIKF